MNVTKEMFRYLEARRHLWNTYFVDFMQSVKTLEEEFPTCDFEQIDKLLFSSLVLHKLCKELKESKYVWGQDPFSYLRVAPRKGMTQMGISICDREGLSGVFNKHIISLQCSHRFDFIEYFDWYRYGYTSYPYYLVRIIRYAQNPDFEGKDALIPTINAEVHFVERD